MENWNKHYKEKKRDSYKYYKRKRPLSPISKIILAIVIIGALGYIVGAFEGIKFENIKEKIGGNGLIKSEREVVISRGCPLGIIPERLELRKMAGFYTLQYSVPPYGRTNNPKWVDGISLRGSSCFVGSKPGENMYHIKCQTGYVKTPNPLDGIIQKDIRYAIDLVLDSRDHTEEGYKVIDFSCKRLKYLEYY